MPELTDEEMAVARRAVQLITTLQGNPEARAHLERAAKVVNPTLITTEDTHAAITAPLQARVDELVDRLQKRDEAEAAARREAQEAEQLGRMESGFQRLRDQYGLQPAGEEQVRTLMKDRTILDPEAAFALFEKQNPVARPEQSSWTPDSWNYERDLMPDAKQWFTDPDRAADDAVGQVLLDMRRNGSGE